MTTEQTHENDYKHWPRASVIDGRRFSTLSDRERQILSLATKGFLDKEIGRELGLSLNTMRTYWSRIRAKVGGVPRAALAAAFVSSHTETSAKTRALSDATYVIDLGSMTVKASDAMNLSHGLAIRKQHPVEAYHRNVHPADLPLLEGVMEDIMSGNEDRLHLNYRLALPTGIRHVSVVVTAVKNAEGIPVQVVGKSVDSFDCRPLLDSRVMFGLWTEDLLTGEFWADDECLGILRLPASKRRCRDSFYRCLHPDSVERARGLVDETVSQFMARNRHDYRLRFDDGSEVWARTDIAIEYGLDGPFRVLGTVLCFA